MWVIKYHYKLDDGSIQYVSCCLRRQETYNIGRSSKYLLNVKNDKSISRQHVSVCWDGDEHQLILTNHGKMTATRGKYLKMGESVTFQVSQEVISVELGTKPIEMEIQWLDFIWDIPTGVSQFTLTLEELGMEVVLQDVREETNLMVFDDMLERDDCRYLYGLIKRIPLMNSKLLTEFCSCVSGHETNFEALWSKIMANRDLWALSDRVSCKETAILQDLDFFLMTSERTAVDEYLNKAIAAGGGKISVVASMQSLKESMESKEITANIVLLGSHPTEEISGFLVHKTHSVKDILGAVLRGDSTELKSGVSKAKEFPKRPNEPVEPTAMNSVVKRRRLNRPKVKPLDSLNFFAGGETLKDQPSSAEVAIHQNSQSILKEPVNETYQDAGEISQSNVTSPPLPLGSLSEDVTREADKRVELPAPASLSGTWSTPKLGSNISPQEVPLQTRQTSAIAPQATTNIRVARNPTLSEYRSSEPAKENSEDNMIQVIQNTKNREIKRLRSTIIQVGEEELTDEAINKLNDLALVDQNDSLIRRRKDDPSTDSHESHPEWNYRKNFKKFVKVWPRYRQHEDQTTREGSSDSIRNRAFLLTRQYVPMRIYTAESERQLHEDLYDFPEPHAEPEELQRRESDDEEQFSFTKANSNSDSYNRQNNHLFAVDEDDSQNAVQLEDPGSKNTPMVDSAVAAGPPRISTHSTQEDDSDDEPTFKFKRKKR